MRRSGTTKNPASKNVRELVREAEEHLRAGEFSRARVLLTSAQAMDPLNDYIAVMLNRAVQAERDGAEGQQRTEREALDNPAENELSGPEQENLRSQVQRLTMVARGLFERGSYDSAFTVLTKAFLMDPLSDEVRQAERDILPAIQKMREREMQEIEAATQAPAPSEILEKQITPARPLAPPPAEPSDDMSRLEQLKRRKEQERLERERAMWRKASEATKIDNATEDGTASAPEAGPPSESGEPEKDSGKLLARLRRGKRS